MSHLSRAMPELILCRRTAGSITTDAMPLRAENYDEFIYFDHHNGKPWSDEEAQRGLDAVA
ncbi:MAG: hypothetical protein ACPLXM_05740 [Bacteroidales bacterium]